MYLKERINLKVFERINNYWLEDASFVSLFFILLFFIFIIPILTFYVESVLILVNITLLFIFLIGIFSCHSKKTKNILFVIYFIYFLVKSYRLFSEEKVFYIYELILSLFLSIVLIYFNLKLLFRDKEVNFYRILGAVNVYFMLVVYSTLFFMLINQFLQPVLSGNVLLTNTDKDFGIFIYYSLTSLTTVGFGDIYATEIIGKQLSVFLSSFGILYPTIVIAQLISKRNS